MKKFLVISSVVLILTTILATKVGLAYYEWTDCKKVGHGTFYCVLKFLR